jgi:nitrate reductase assembly molybdenum cofactor insertion protein NarJ
MTSVIGAPAIERYLRRMAATDHLERLAAVLVRPDEGYLGRIEALRETLTGQDGEAARQLGVFTARLTGLSVEELQELFDETFDACEVSALTAVARQLTESAPDRVPVLDVLITIEHLHSALEADRNPFVYLFKGLCCLVLACHHNGRAGAFFHGASIIMTVQLPSWPASSP